MACVYWEPSSRRRARSTQRQRVSVVPAHETVVGVIARHVQAAHAALAAIWLLVLAVPVLVSLVPDQCRTQKHGQESVQTQDFYMM